MVSTLRKTKESPPHTVISQSHTKRRETVVRSDHIYSIRNGITALSVGLAATGFWLVSANPQFTNSLRDKQIFENGVLKTEVIIEPSKTSQLLGLGCLSVSLLGLVGALKIGSPSNLDHPAISEEVLSSEKDEKILKTVSEKITATSSNQQVDDLKVDQSVENLVTKLVNEIAELPWLLKMIKCPSIVIVGNTGSGKSRLAMSIALIQAVINQNKLVIIDPDANGDIDRGTWIAGDIYGYYQDSQNSQISDIIEGISRVKNPLNTKLTAIFDELSKYRDYPGLEDYLEPIIASGSQEQRKKSGCSIYLLHGFEKGMISEKLPSGRWKRLLETSAVIYLPCDSDMFGQPVKGDWLIFKEPNQLLTKDGSFNGTAYDLPKALDPSLFLQVYGSLIKLMGLELSINCLNKNSDKDKAKSELLDQVLPKSSIVDTKPIASDLDLVVELEQYVARSRLFQIGESIEIKRLYDCTRKQLESKGLLNSSNKLELFRKTLESSASVRVSADRKFVQFLSKENH